MLAATARSVSKLVGDWMFTILWHIPDVMRHDCTIGVVNLVSSTEVVWVINF